MKISLSLVLNIVLLAAFLYEFFCSPIQKERVSQKRFEGQVAGFLAGLSLFDVISSYTAREICSFAMDEARRCQKIKKPPGIQEDPLWYASHGDFGEFAFLCMEHYAEENKNQELLDYCKEHKIIAQKLTAYPEKW